MNKQCHSATLLSKSYSLCLIFALVGYIPATTPSSILIDTRADTWTEMTLPSLSVFIPIETLQVNEVRNGLLIWKCEHSSSSMFDSAHPPVIDGKEQTDWSFTLTNHLNQLQHDPRILQLYEYSVNGKIEQRIVTVNNLPNEQYLFAAPNCLTNQLRGSGFGPSSLQNSGGGGGGGRRRNTQGKL